MKTPMEISAEEINAFATLYPTMSGPFSRSTGASSRRASNVRPFICAILAAMFPVLRPPNPCLRRSSPTRPPMPRIPRK